MRPTITIVISPEQLKKFIESVERLQETVPQELAEAGHAMQQSKEAMEHFAAACALYHLSESGHTVTFKHPEPRKSLPTFEAIFSQYEPGLVARLAEICKKLDEELPTDNPES